MEVDEQRDNGVPAIDETAVAKYKRKLVFQGNFYESNAFVRGQGEMGGSRWKSYHEQYNIRFPHGYDCAIGRGTYTVKHIEVRAEQSRNGAMVETTIVTHSPHKYEWFDLAVKAANHHLHTGEWLSGEDLRRKVMLHSAKAEGSALANGAVYVDTTEILVCG